MSSVNKRNNGTNTRSIVVIVMLVIIILILLYPTIVQFIPVFTTPLINVSGSVRVTGFTAVPDHVTFVGGGSPNTAAISRDGSYSIMLDNGHVYNITVAWTAVGGLDSGNCTGGSLNLHSSIAKLTYNVSC